MRKLLSIIIGMVMLGVFAISATGCGNNADFNIGIIQLVEHTALDRANEGFRDELTALLEAEGKTVSFDNRNAQGTQSTAKDISDRFVNRKVDLILSIATGAAAAAVNAAQSTEIPVLFTAVTDPLGEKFVSSMQEPGKRVSGTTDMNPVAEQIALLKTLMGDKTRVGIIYNFGETNSVAQANIAKEAATLLGLVVEEGNVTTAADVKDVFNSIAAKVDGIYLPTDNLVANSAGMIHSANKELAQSGKAVPIVCGETGMNDSCGIATYGGVDYYELGKQTARMAFRILMEGADITKMPVERQEGSAELSINEIIAGELGITIPDATRNFEV